MIHAKWIKLMNVRYAYLSKAGNEMVLVTNGGTS